MAYVKSIADNFGRWQNVYLTDQEEEEVELEANIEHNEIMKKCLEDAKGIYYYTKMGKHTNVESELSKLNPDAYMYIAIALFKVRASHTQYARENAAREKFDLEHPTPKRPDSIQTINQKSKTG